MLALGLTSSLLGILLIVLPSLGGIISPSGAVRTVPFALIGVLSLVFAAGYALAGTRSSAEGGDGHRSDGVGLPTPENRPQYREVGATLARRLDTIEWTDRREEEPTNRLQLRTELREAAVRVLSRTEDWTRTEIETLLDDGRWSDDGRATAFFSDDVVPTLSLRQQLRMLRRTEPVFARRARHAIAEIAGRSAAIDVSSSLSDSARRALDDSPPVSVRQYWPPDADESTREFRTGDTRVVTAAALAAGGLGVLTLRPALFLLAVFGITVAGYARVASAPTGAIDVRRTLSDDEPDPGAEVEVTVVVRNVSDTTITDLRLIDGVPAGLTVVEGSPRFSTALRPGKEATFTYSVEAVYGVHAFDPALLITRDVTGIYKRETLVETAATTLSCRLPTHPVDNPPRRRTTVHAGRARSTVAGSGVEFHSVRDHRPGDPLSRIDWKRKAKTGELTTVDFHETRLENVLVLIDARAEAYVTASRDGDEPIIRKGVTAGHHITSRLLAESVPVGLMALSPRSCWLAPSVGDAHHRRIQNTLAGHPSFGWTAPDGDFDSTAALRVLSQRLSLDTQIIFISPLCDDAAAGVARRLDAYGYAVSVVSPDPTASASSKPSCDWGYAVLERRFRLSSLRNAQIPVVDWNPTESFAGVMRREV
ncbi:DUF58 domain-containing protein [Halopelagius longus]|uniref:DUF58 domain-containing protein n=1 Tax=Halopelagius longus TaxID=1236180 RepID=UPI002852E8D8|nr:DUF58 domain-containing protein [Halopelagius longus]